MANGDTSSNPKGILSVRIGPELLRRVNRVVYFLHRSQVSFVTEALEEKTKEYEAKYQTELSVIAKQEQKIMDRETSSGSTMEQDENGQGAIRRGSAPDARKTSVTRARLRRR